MTGRAWILIIRIWYEEAKADKEAQGEFESECPGYCGAQDTFYGGTLKGVGWVSGKPSSTASNRVVQQPVEHRGRQHRIPGKGLIP